MPRRTRPPAPWAADAQPPAADPEHAMRKQDPFQQLADNLAQHVLNQFATKNPDIAAFFNLNAQAPGPQPQQHKRSLLRPGAVIKDAEFTLVPKKRA